MHCQLETMFHLKRLPAFFPFFKTHYCDSNVRVNKEGIRLPITDICSLSFNRVYLSYIDVFALSDLTAGWLAQMPEYRTSVWEGVGSKPGWTNHHSL